MADLVFSGLKLAYKAFKAYSDVKSELAEFEEDFEELEMRLHALEPVLSALDGRLTDELTMVLTIAKREQEKANAYTEDLFAYCRRFKDSGSKFKAMATALANKAIDSLPDGLREGAQALAPVISKHGPPEKAYAKFAEKLHFLMSSLSAAAAAQVLKGPTGHTSSANRSHAPAPASAVTALPPKTEAKSEGKQSDAHDTKEAEPVVLSAAEQSAKLSEMVNEMVEEDEADFRAILIGQIRKMILVFAVWVDKVPHLMFVAYSGASPSEIHIMRAPSTKWLVDLSQTGLPPAQCCRKQEIVLKKLCQNDAMRELKIGRLEYTMRHQRRVANKWVFVAALLMPFYVGYCVLCCIAAFAKRLQIRDFRVGNKTYNIMIQNSTELSVNGQMLLDAKDLGYGQSCLGAAR